MSAPTTSRSAYPPQVDDLLPRALRLADKLGEPPSQRRLITELRIGAPKARVLAQRVAEARQAQGHADPPADDEVRTEAAADAAEEVSDHGADTPEDAPTDALEPTGEVVPFTQAPVPVDTPTAVPETASVVASEAVVADAPVAVSEPRPSVRTWPLLLLALPAFVAIWSGWVGLGGLTGFGDVHPLPGIADRVHLNTAITLPVGVETYAAYALRVWLSGRVPPRARRFAKWSAIGSLALGAAGQVAFHLMTAAGVKHAPWQITTLVACLPVAVLGMGAALTHLLRTTED